MWPVSPYRDHPTRPSSQPQYADPRELLHPASLAMMLCFLLPCAALSRPSSCRPELGRAPALGTPRSPKTLQLLASPDDADASGSFVPCCRVLSWKDSESNDRFRQDSCSGRNFVALRELIILLRKYGAGRFCRVSGR